MITICFDNGTLTLRGEVEDHPEVAAHCRFDPRIGHHRAAAIDYAAIVLHLHRHGIAYDDQARAFDPVDLPMRSGVQPRDYQEAALTAWSDAQRRGVVVLPTGSGKSLVGMLAIHRTGRPALIVVPTLDLMSQWASQVERHFGVKAGLLGGGNRELAPITVSTYDSAVLTMPFYGNRYGLIICDECHHLPGEVNRQAALMAIAPFRLGLTATPERDDGEDQALERLIGPICYQRHIDEFDRRVLANYDVIPLSVPMDEDEQVSYRHYRQRYLAFVRAHGISFSRPDGWSQFVGLCARMPGGREAFTAWLEQKRISRGSRAKFRVIWDLLRRHAGQRTLIFTADNDTAYEIGRRLVLPVITHRTKVKERKAFLDAFRAGDYPVLVTSKVLNEGIDVPEASVGIVVSGSGSVREHVQRLGRLLRPAAAKQAQLYELVSEGTSEGTTSERRRQHRAYQRPR